ncbi:aldo/keto reductase [Nocardioides donggukensis]|uniref:Aldo/keto reductase n=1 Tax=Nocardioides donggukensis TaxID=2774019 RepID=A0A927KAA5_9ACTN|nr:aldo/keto reductase [Nocardioides donggukensis]MBD8870535.1 aldo/keto reductase [Nocardioides donggukensis]
MRRRRIGERTVSAIGLGAMPLSRPRTSTGELPPRAEAIATVHAALDAGIDLIDTADCYAPDDTGLGHNEVLVGAALRAAGSPDVLVATKGGIRRDGSAWPVSGRPEWIRKALEGSLSRLRVEAIGLYQSHRPDPEVPYAETMGAFRQAYDDGLVERVGISNADPAQIREARSVLGDALVSVQNEYSPRFRSSEEEIDLCEQLDLAFLPWSPLGGMREGRELGARHQPFADVAQAHGVSPHQVCLAWMLARSPVLVPIPGASRPASITDCAAAVHLRLTDEELARLNGSDGPEGS